MTERTEQTIPQAIGELIRELDQQRKAYEQALASFVALQRQMTAMDVKVRLVTEAAAAALTGAADGQPAAGPAQEAAGSDLPALLARVGADLVTAINRRALSLAGQDPAAAERRRAEVGRFRTHQYEPLRQSLEQQLTPLFQTLGYGGVAEFQPALDRFRDWSALVLRFGATLDELAEGPAQLWDGQVDVTAPDVTQWIELKRVGEVEVPQIRAEAVADLLAEVNRSIRFALESRLGPDRPDGERPEKPLAERLERLFLDLLERALDLKHSLREAVAQRKGAGQEVPAAAGEILKALTSLLQGRGLDEMEVQLGKQPNARLHRVVGYESRPGYAAGSIVRVLVPGYYYQENLVRMAQVMVSS